MRKGKKRGVKYVYPVEWILRTNKKFRGSVLINGGLTIGSFNAQIILAGTGSASVFEEPTGLAEVRKSENKSFEVDSVMYINDVKKKLEDQYFR